MALWIIHVLSKVRQFHVGDCEGFLTTSHKGRLGNKMISYATLYVKAKIYGYKPVISDSYSPSRN